MDIFSLEDIKKLVPDQEDDVNEHKVQHQITLFKTDLLETEVIDDKQFCFCYFVHGLKITAVRFGQCHSVQKIIGRKIHGPEFLGTGLESQGTGDKRFASLM